MPDYYTDKLLEVSYEAGYEGLPYVADAYDLNAWSEGRKEYEINREEEA